MICHSQRHKRHKGDTDILHCDRGLSLSLSLISSHLISSHLISSHLISSHLISSLASLAACRKAMYLQAICVLWGLWGAPGSLQRTPSWTYPTQSCSAHRWSSWIDLSSETTLEIFGNIFRRKHPLREISK